MHKTSRFLACSAGTLALYAALQPASAAAQTPSSEEAPPAQSAEDEADRPDIVVTGSRLAGTGYTSPSPVTVIGSEQIATQPVTRVALLLERLPAFAASAIGSFSLLQTGNSANLRGLGPQFTLVLLDGHRFVPTEETLVPNLNLIPSHLISRVETVIGGASAAYGSDAVAGAVNFILDTDFTGIKADVQGGITARQDDPSYAISVSGGTEFAGGRGHAMVSAGTAWNEGIFGIRRSRDRFIGGPAQIFPNPAYNAVTNNTVPAYLLRLNASSNRATAGGIINTGPLRGTYFGENGLVAGTYDYGQLFGSYTVGGDYRLSDQPLSGAVSSNDHRITLFGRLSYDLTDRVTAWAQAIYGYNRELTWGKLDDQLGLTIQRDNAFLDPTVAASMTALGQQTFTMGSFNLDAGNVTPIGRRESWTYSGGVDGELDLLGREWNWSLFGAYGLSRTTNISRTMILPNFLRAIDAVRTGGGQIVCRVNADAVTTNDDPACVPWNVFGYNQNGPAAVDYVKGDNTLFQRFTHWNFAVDVSGEPFDTWAGPVAVAFGAEWRRNTIDGTADPLSPLRVYTTANFLPTVGDLSVKEAYLEVAVPLAEDAAWADSLEINGAVRATDYSVSGYVTTWKGGVTWSPFSDLMLRATRSRDIRAPNLGDLYRDAGGSLLTNVSDPFRPGIPNPNYLSRREGNINLKPEESDTFTAGVSYRPSWLPGLGMSVDYYKIEIDGAITTYLEQAVVDRCFAGLQDFCDAIERGPPEPGQTIGPITVISGRPFNATVLQQEGLDLEASYTTALGNGRLSLRGLATYIAYSRRLDGPNVLDTAGTNNTTGPVRWRATFFAGYDIGPVSLNWTGRYLSPGRFTPYLGCTPGSCPVSTPTALTIDFDHIDAAFYNDLSFSYRILENGNQSVEAFLNVANVLDKRPPISPWGTGFYFFSPANTGLYDHLGTRFFAGVRVRM